MNCCYKIYPKKTACKKTQNQVEPKNPKPVEFAKSKPTVPKKRDPILFNNFECVSDLRRYYGDSHRNVYNATDKEYKEYITKSVFSEFWRGTSKDGILTFPNGNIILTNVRFDNLKDIDLIESIELKISPNSDVETIPTSIFPQLQEFYKMRNNQLPFFLFKYGLPLCAQECTLKFNFKENIEKRDISIVANININYNDQNVGFATPVYLVKDVEYDKDKHLIDSSPYFFIPEEKIDNIQLMLDNRYIINLAYDYDKKIVPLVKGLDVNLYWNYMLDFKRVDMARLKFAPEHKMKLYFVCYNEYMFKDGYGGYFNSM